MSDRAEGQIGWDEQGEPIWEWQVMFQLVTPEDLTFAHYEEDGSVKPMDALPFDDGAIPFFPVRDCWQRVVTAAGFDLTGITVGDTVVVQGSGPVGMAAAMDAQLAGAAKVIVVGGPASRLALARELGVGDCPHRRLRHA